MFEKRLKGSLKWRRISEAEAKQLVVEGVAWATGVDQLRALKAGETVRTPYAFVRVRPEPEPAPAQPNLPGVGEGSGAYRRG